jgi:hypothetical protein
MYFLSMEFPVIKALKNLKKLYLKIPVDEEILDNNRNEKGENQNKGKIIDN